VVTLYDVDELGDGASGGGLFVSRLVSISVGTSYDTSSATGGLLLVGLHVGIIFGNSCNTSL
jgi:hypothetical protein